MSKSLRVMTVGLFVAGAAALAGCGGSTAPTPAAGKNPITTGNEEQKRMETKRSMEEQRAGDALTPPTVKHDTTTTTTRKDDTTTPTTRKDDTTTPTTTRKDDMPTPTTTRRDNMPTPTTKR